MSRIRPLRNPIREYDWGSRTELAELMGRPGPRATPEAELWMGAHPAALPAYRLDGDATVFRAGVPS